MLIKLGLFREAIPELPQISELPRYRDKCYINRILRDKCHIKGQFREKCYS